MAQENIQCNGEHNFRFNRLHCSACQGSLVKHSATGGLCCVVCKTQYPLVNGYINMIVDPDLKTNLIEADYDGHHLITLERRKAHWLTWRALLERYGAHQGTALEIGSGTGQMSWGLLHESHFSEVHLSDISPTFLSHIEKNLLQGSKNNAYFYLCDANQLPFKHGMFDCVVGNSVLHHFLYYEKTLECCFNVLKKGGKALFFEPVLQGKAFVALGLKLLLSTDEKSNSPIFDDKEKRKIRAVIHHQKATAIVKDDIAALKTMEDKYIFDVDELKSLAHRVGFSECRIENFATLDAGYAAYIKHQLFMLGIKPVRIKPYEFVFEAIRDTVGVMLKGKLTTPMCYIVFEK